MAYLIDIGTTIWFYYLGLLCSGKVSGIFESGPTQTGYYEVQLCSINGINSGGTTRCNMQDAYPTKLACTCAHKLRSAARVNRIKATLPDVASLLKLALTIPITGEHCDYEAREAVIKRAQELGYENLTDMTEIHYE